MVEETIEKLAVILGTAKVPTVSSGNFTICSYTFSKGQCCVGWGLFHSAEKQ